MRRSGIIALAVAMLVPLALNAQRYERDRRDRRYDDRRSDDRRDWEERRGRVAGLIADLERRTDDFKVSLRRAMDHSRMDGSRREDILNDQATRLERAVNRLHESWNQDRDFERSRRHLSVALSAGQDIHRTMMRHHLRGSVQREWEIVRRELNRLAEVFREPPIRWE